MYEFWNQGERYAVVGVSDNHNASEVADAEHGTPRTYAYADPGAGPRANETE